MNLVWFGMGLIAAITCTVGLWEQVRPPTQAGVRQTSKALLFGAGMSVLALSFVLVMAFLVEVAL